MFRTVKICAAVLLLTALATMVLVVRQYRWGRAGAAASYTSIVKRRDIIDTARNALAALNDAALSAEDYVLTGETVYSEAYAKDVRDWEDESGTLEVIAEKDPALPLARNLRKAGKDTLDELNAVIALYDKAGRDPAFDRIRKTSSLVYLGRARQQVADIIAFDRNDLAYPLFMRSKSATLRLTEYSVGLCVMTIAAAVLAFAAARHSQSSKVVIETDAALSHTER